jgi:site-specific DNA recombinase
MPHLDQWLLRAFCPHRLTDTVDRLHAAQQDTPVLVPDADLEAVIAECDTKLAQYRAIADAGGDPGTIASWTADVMAQRAAAVARRTITNQCNTSNRLSKAQLYRLAGDFGGVREALTEADPADKAELYQRLRVTLTYDPGKHRIRVLATPNADSNGVMVRVRGPTRGILTP